jgi:hypothetical protein
MFARTSIPVVATALLLGLADWARSAEPGSNVATATVDGIKIAISIPARIKVGDPMPFTVRLENPGGVSAAVWTSAAFFVGKATVTRRTDAAVLPLLPSGIRWLDDDPVKMRYRGQSGWRQIPAERSYELSMDLRDHYRWFAGPYEIRYATTLTDRRAGREFRVTVEALKFEVVD